MTGNITRERLLEDLQRDREARERLEGRLSRCWKAIGHVLNGEIEGYTLDEMSAEILYEPVLRDAREWKVLGGKIRESEKALRKIIMES